ncbi:MAG: TonB-dependent receptor domain-containing protein [Pyrinomonadaceae bacterium]
MLRKSDLLKKTLLTSLLLIISAGAHPALAQDTVTGAFEGTISDSQTGAALKGAFVEIINQQTGVTISLRTDFRGRFFQGLLIPGIYRIRVSSDGYQTKEVTQHLKITYTGEVIPVPVALDPAPAVPPPVSTPTPAPAVGDTDVRASIISTDARRSGSFTEEEVAALPLGGSTFARTFDELALLLPGVAPPPQTLGSVAGPGVGPGVGSAGQFAVNGLRSRGNNFTVDGSDNNDEDIGVRRQGFVALIPQPIESVQEYQLITLLAPAQFGRNIGGQVNAVSKSGGNETHATLYSIFNSSRMNARNLFDSTFGNSTTAVGAGGKPVLQNGRPLTVTNQSGGEDSFTFTQGGFVIGGPLAPSAKGKRHSAFYFISAEGQVTNATKENSFAVPTVEERGIFGSGATGLSRDPFSGAAITAFPTTVSGDAVFSLYPFPNNTNGIYGANTLTLALPAGGQSKNVSGKVDGNFLIGARAQSITSRYNFTDDWRDISVVGGALFSTIHPRVRTQNWSNFLNSEIGGPHNTTIFNQVRASFGRTRLVFEENRDRQFLRPSRLANSLRPNERRFLLNAPLFTNDTTPASRAVLYDSFFSFGTEDILGPVGQIGLAGYSPIGVDVFNFPQERVNNTYQLADNFSWRQGNHSVTLGLDFRRTELHSDLPRNARPLLTFNGAPAAQRTPAGNFQLSGFVRPIDLAAASAPSGILQVLQTSPDSRIDLRYYQYDFFAEDNWRIRPNLSLSLGLRYEYNTPVAETHRRIEKTFTDTSLSLVPGLQTFLGTRRKIYDPDRNNFGPRLGFAYSTHFFGSNRASVLRAGYGMFYDQAIGAVVSQSRNVFPNFLTLNLAGGLPNASGVGFNISDPTLPFFPCTDANGTRFFSLVQPGTLNTLNPAVPLSCLVAINTSFPGGFGFTLPQQQLRMPEAQHYSFTWEQELNRKTVLSLAYVGTHGRKLLRLTTPNLGPNAFLVPTTINVANFSPNVSGLALGPGQLPGATGASGGRPIVRAGAVMIYESSAMSNYNSFQAQLRGRLGRSTQYQVSYTLSKAVDDVSDVFDLAGAPALPQNSFTFAGERGPANFDVRHRFAYNFISALPEFRNRSRAFRAFFGNLQIAGTGALRTGQPFTVNTIFDVNLDGNLTDRLDNTNGLVVTGNRRQPLRLTATDPTALLAPIGQDGRIGRNTFRAGNVVELDLSASKKLFVSGSKSLVLRADIFNFINRANFGVPVRWLGAIDFGQATETITPARRLQVEVKFAF